MSDEPVGFGAAQHLRDAGLHVTASRLAVLEVPAHSPHSTAATVTRLAGARLGKVSTQAVYDAGCAVGARPCLALGDDAGHLLDEAEIVFWGLCPSCQHNTRPTTSTKEES